MAFTQVPLDGSTPPIAMSSAVPDSTNTPKALEGGPVKTTGGNDLVPAAVYMYDGYNETMGLKNDAAATADSGTFSLMALFKRLLAKFPAIGPQVKAASLSVTLATDNPNVPVSGTVTETNSAGIKTDLDTLAGAVSSSKMATKAASGDYVDGSNVAIGTTTQTKATDGTTTSWSLIQLLKGIFDKLLGTLAVTQSGTWTVQPGNTANTTAWKVDGSAVTQPVSGTVTANAGTNMSTASLALEGGGNLATLAGIVSSSKAATKAASGDFADGAIVGIGTTTQTKATDATTTSWSAIQLLKGIFSSLLGVLSVGRSTVAVYSLASTTTSGSTQNSGDLTVGPYTELSLDINTTAQAGTSPTIQYFYERKAADGIYYVLWQSAVLTAAANTLSTSIGPGLAYNQSLGVTGRLRWVVGGSATPTYTHSLNIQCK